MARERKRPDWPQIVYKYHVQTAVIPQAMWDTARKMQDLWCRLAELHKAARLKINDETTPDQKKALWLEYEDQVDALESSAGLNWECGPEVVDRFKSACRRAISQKDGGWPKVGGLKTICIPHRYTGGGVSVQSIAGSASKRFNLSHSDTGLVAGTFGLGDDESIRFDAVVHRPIPSQAFVKRVRWCGKRSVFGWRWSISITVEVPPVERLRQTGMSVGIDLGWRKVASGVRVAYAVASNGESWDMVVPLSRTTRSIRKHNERFPDQRIPTSYQELRDLQETISRAKDAVKAAVADLLETKPPGWERMGVRGLRRMLHEDYGDAVHEVLRTWSERHHSMTKRFVSATEQFVEKRRWLFRNWASDIANKYDKIVIEGGLSVKDMVEAASEQPGDTAINKSLRYHQIAATSELMMFIKQAAAKHGAVIVNGDTSGTTSICTTCGCSIEKTSSQVLTCDNGHVIDRDKNSCLNLLSQIERPEVWKERLRVFNASRRRKRPVLCEAVG
jgi:hypothetical protein